MLRQVGISPETLNRLEGIAMSDGEYFVWPIIKGEMFGVPGPSTFGDAVD